MMRWIVCVVLGIAAAACSGGSSSGHEAQGSTGASTTSGGGAETPNANTPAPQCTPTQFIGAAGRCFDTLDAACASLPCAREQCISQETAPARAHCR